VTRATSEPVHAQCPSFSLPSPNTNRFAMRKLILLCWLAPALALAQGQSGEFTSFDGTLIYYETQGQGPPVLLLHGFIVDRTMWQRGPLVQQLVQAGHRVIVPDLRGNGRSGKPQTLAAYQNDAEARDLMALATHLGLRRYQVVGYSRGAIIAARLLVLDRRVRAAALGGMGAHFTDPKWPRRWAMAEAFAGRPTPATQPALAYARAIGADTLAMHYLQVAQPVTSPAELGRVRRPVLVIAGDQDTDNGPAAELAQLLPRATLKTVPGNHNNTPASAGFADAVVGFLQKK
jgi:pimeloyl-ACP methyl ester carboxylesterase